MDAREHYDAVARLGARRRSPLQLFHNAAKRAMLEAFAAGSESLLDLACGRGGDLHKWRALGIPRVLGVDVSEHSLEEARARTAKVGAPYAFRRADLCRSVDLGGTFDVVTCMFALHYFFESERTAHALMETVARHLKPGGAFLGIVPDAERVVELVKNGPFRNGVVAVRAEWSGQPRHFGSAYTWSLHGTVTEGSRVPEYLVHGDALRDVAAAHGLHPVPMDLPMFESEGVLHGLLPPYGGAMGQASRTYAAFAFRARPQTFFV